MPLQLQALLAGVLWLVFLVMFLRSRLQRKPFDVQARLGWAQFFLGVLIFSIQGENVDRAFAGLTDNLPLILYVKYFAFTFWIWLYFQSVKSLMADRPLFPWFGYWFRFTILTGWLSISLWFILPVSVHGDLRNLVYGWRDVLLLIPIITLFVPLNWKLWRQEKFRGMKSKHFANLVCMTMYGLIAMIDITAAIATLLPAEGAYSTARLAAPFLLVGVVAFLIILLPYRWIGWILYPTRLRLYWKLQSLENAVLVLVGRTPRPIYARFRHPAELELAIYQSVITILDFGLLLALHPAYHQLYEQIQVASQNQYSYSKLVEQLAGIKYDRSYT